MAQRKEGSLVQLEGGIIRAIDIVSLPSSDVWYPYTSTEKNASFAMQCSGDVPVDLSLNSGDVFTLKAGTVLAMDAQLSSTSLYFRHHSNAAQQMQIVRIV